MPDSERGSAQSRDRTWYWSRYRPKFGDPWAGQSADSCQSARYVKSQTNQRLEFADVYSFISTGVFVEVARYLNDACPKFRYQPDLLAGSLQPLLKRNRLPSKLSNEPRHTIERLWSTNDFFAPVTAWRRGIERDSTNLSRSEWKSSTPMSFCYCMLALENMSLIQPERCCRYDQSMLSIVTEICIYCCEY